MTPRCATVGCHREPRPGYANCDDHTSRLLAQAFGEQFAPVILRTPRRAEVDTPPSALRGVRRAPVVGSPRRMSGGRIPKPD